MCGNFVVPVRTGAQCYALVHSVFVIAAVFAIVMYVLCCFSVFCVMFALILFLLPEI